MFPCDMLACNIPHLTSVQFTVYPGRVWSIGGRVQSSALLLCALYTLYCTQYTVLYTVHTALYCTQYCTVLYKHSCGCRGQT